MGERLKDVGIDKVFKEDNDIDNEVEDDEDDPDGLDGFDEAVAPS